ncbi:chitinase-like protein 1-like, partial [Trifolium pratense]
RRIYYLDLLGVDREQAGTHDVLTCANQLPFNPNTKLAAS